MSRRSSTHSLVGSKSNRLGCFRTIHSANTRVEPSHRLHRMYLSTISPCRFVFLVDRSFDPQCAHAGRAITITGACTCGFPFIASCCPPLDLIQNPNRHHATLCHQTDQRGASARQVGVQPRRQGLGGMRPAGQAIQNRAAQKDVSRMLRSFDHQFTSVR